MFELKWHIIGAIFAACVFILYGAEAEWFYLDQTNTFARAMIGIVAVVTGFLFLGHIASIALVAISAEVNRRQTATRKRKREQEVLAFLDTLSQEEHRVLSYLVQRNQQSFTGNLTGSKIATLKQKGLILMGGGHFDLDDVPFTIPRYVWEELQRRRPEFNSADLKGPQPWRDTF